MKKALAASLSLFALASISQIAFGEAPTYEAKFAAAPIKVDGKLDDAAWKNAVTVALAPDDAVVKSYGMVWDENKATGNFRVMWDDKYVYFGFSMKDGQLNTGAEDINFWQNDNVSGFLYDEDKEVNIKFFTAPKAQDAYTLTGVVGAGVALNEDAITGVQIVKGGYDVEVAFPWDAIAGTKPVANDTMAFTTLVIDKNENWGQYMWVGDGDNVPNFATIKFIK